MINRYKKTTKFALKAISVVIFAMAPIGAWAQDTTTSTVRRGEPTFETKVRNAEIVYVEGNDLVLKLESGKVEHMVVPSNEKFTVDGRDVTVGELKPGSKLTQTITTTTTPHFVNTVRNLKGRVWHVNAPRSVIITLPDGTNQLYKVPSHAKFKIGGKDKTVFELKKGMSFEATIVTDEPQNVVELSKTNVVQGPALATPPQVGVLLIDRPAPAREEIASSVTAEHVDTLPNTGSALPLAGLLGLLGIGSAAGLGVVRKLVKVKA